MEDLTRAAMDLARDRICRAHPYLALALERLKAEPSDAVETAETDGSRLFCNPAWVRACVLGDDHRLEETLFHALSHCLLGHVYLPESDAPDWARALACDYQAALLAAQSAPELCPVRRDGGFQELVRRFGSARDAEALARSMAEDDYVMKNRDALVKRLTLDGHGRWRAAREAARERAACGGSGDAQAWRGLARRLGIGSGGGLIGRNPGGERLDIHLKDGPRHDFAAALRRYAALREVSMDDPDSFQYPWYLYGLEHLDGAPLIEPMEYREERGLDALAIAIDTSGSCARGLTQRFLELTRDILFDRRLFARRFKLCILQCDAKVQREDWITSRTEFERYIDHLTVIGGGGTDFRPAIRRIAELKSSGVLRGLKGALYFSDGRGIYPAAPPDFEVAFVFLKHRFDGIDLPAWAHRLVIDAPAPRSGEY